MNWSSSQGARRECRPSRSFTRTKAFSREGECTAGQASIFPIIARYPRRPTRLAPVRCVQQLLHRFTPSK